MASYKEIVTKAIVGKGKKYFKNNHYKEHLVFEETHLAGIVKLKY